MSETGARNASASGSRSDRLSRNMTMHPFHRVGSAEGQDAGQHPIERHTKSVEVSAGIDRAVHSPGLFGRHVGECACDNFWRLWRPPLARQP